MAWRKFENHKEETKAVKKALVGDYPDVQVKHGRGTAWGWLEVSCTIPRPENCYCKELNEGQRFPESCPACKEEWRRVYDLLGNRVREITGRSGEYGGCINYDVQFNTEIPSPASKPEFKTYLIEETDDKATRLLKIVANRLNVEEHERPGGVYILAAQREEINSHLDKSPLT